MTDRSPYALTWAAVTATAVLGGIGTAPGTRWYRGLDKPPWQPPASAFGPVWTALHVLLRPRPRPLAREVPRVGTARVPAGPPGRPGARRRLELAVLPRPATGAATAEAVLLAASTADLARRSWTVDRRAGAALVPYAAWTSFAAALTASIARRNPR